MSAMSERMSSRLRSRSCNCLFVYSNTDTCNVFVRTHWRFMCIKSTQLLKATHFGVVCPKTNGWMGLWMVCCICGPMLVILSSCPPGQHRSLGPSISKVRSLKLDSSIWSNALVEVCVSRSVRLLPPASCFNVFQLFDHSSVKLWARFGTDFTCFCLFFSSPVS